MNDVAESVGIRAPSIYGLLKDRASLKCCRAEGPRCASLTTSQSFNCAALCQTMAASATRRQFR
jgi:hypothetical protein